jgi:hypothetical protein
MLFPEQQERGVRAVAIFTDGLAYLVMPGAPRSRLADDARKRAGIAQGGEMLSWSLTWKDVVSPDAPAVPKWLGDGIPFSGIQSLAFKIDAQKPGAKLSTLLRLLDSDPLRALVAYLEAPTRMRELAPLAAYMLLNGGKRQPTDRVKDAHTAWHSSADAPSLPLLVTGMATRA